MQLTQALACEVKGLFSSDKMCLHHINSKETYQNDQI